MRNIIKKSRAEFRSQKRDNVISSLYRRAMGYTVTEVRETIKLNAEGEQIEKKIVYHKKYIKPSERAIKYFLENFDEDGYEIFPDNDDDPLQGTCFLHTDVPLSVLLCTQSGRREGVDDGDDNDDDDGNDKYDEDIEEEEEISLDEEENHSVV